MSEIKAALIVSELKFNEGRKLLCKHGVAITDIKYIISRYWYGMFYKEVVTGYKFIISGTVGTLTSLDEEIKNVNERTGVNAFSFYAFFTYPIMEP